MGLMVPVSRLDDVLGASMGLDVRAVKVRGKALQRCANCCEEGGEMRWEGEAEGWRGGGLYVCGFVLLYRRIKRVGPNLSP